VDPIDHLERLDREWRLLAAGSLRAELARWSRRNPGLARFETPWVLLRFLRAPGDAEAKDDLLRTLLTLARTEPLAGRVVLQALLPGLKAQAGRQLFGAEERDELWELTLAHCWEQIRCYPLGQRPRRVAANILLDTLHATLGERKRERRFRQELTNDDAPVASGVAAADVEAPLRAAVTARALTGSDAELILLTRIDGLSLAEASAALGVSYNVARVKLQRAERRLFVFLGHRPVPKRGSNRPFSSARASGTER
jgi:DNA-directed RNA polymerase specialized sigma24 family protein